MRVLICLLTVRIPAMFAIMPFPVLRSMMSKVVSKSEQGELFSENHCSKAKLLIQLDVGHKSSPLLKRPWLCGVKAFIQSGVKFKSPYVKRNLKVVLFALLPCMHSSFEKTITSDFSLFTLHVFSGALFACVAFMENLSSNVSAAVFSRIYADTVAWCPGFVFLLAAGLCLIPISLLG